MEDATTVHEPDFGYSGSYSYADYLRWTITERVELIRGKIFRMSPAPNRVHQTLSGYLHGHLWSFLKGHRCKVYSAPFDVRFPRVSKNDSEVFTVLQPDICVVCDDSKLDEKGCIGAPDLVIEILSPGNNKKELQNKYDVYEESGVMEYWLVSPQDCTLLIYTLQPNGQYQAGRLMTSGDIATSAVLQGLALNLEELFADLI